MIAVICPGCHRKLAIKDAFAGKKGSCPHCKERIKVPAASGEKTSPSISDEEATVGGSFPPELPDEQTLPPPDNAPSLTVTAGERLDFLAPPQGPGELGRLGSYRVLKVLGAGGMGLVLQGEDPMLKRAVALKVMRPELAAGKDARERFLREAQATAAIEHPHIIHVYQVAEDRGVPFLAMPFLKGEPLDARLRREPRLPVEEVISLGKQIAEGLAAAHKKGLIHRDIKPGNLWLEPHEGERGSGLTNWVKILDFGLARALTGDDVNLTKTGMILGTPAYMAPEQARGEKVDGRCDLFSLGAVLYRMLTGELPFKGSDTISILMALATEEPQMPRKLNPQIPQGLADLVMQLLAKDPAQRPASAREVADRLAILGKDRTEILRGASVKPVPRGAGGWPRWILPVGGGVALVGLIVVAFVWSVGWSVPKVRQDRPEQDFAALVTDSEGRIVNSVGVRLREILPGKVRMGSLPKERHPNEQQHDVTITRPYWIGIHEVTVGQFTTFVNDTNYQTGAETNGKGALRKFGARDWQWHKETNWRNPGFPTPQTDDHPVVCVSWIDAMKFCEWLSDRERRKYTLPTEAQWEQCCRAGTRTRFSFGDNAKQSDDHAWFINNSAGLAHPVGKKKPNDWGLYDMHGNAGEWCSDIYQVDLGRKPVVDPLGPRDGPPGKDPTRVIRGGSFTASAQSGRSASRGELTQTSSRTNVGFRVVLEK